MRAAGKGATAFFRHGCTSEDIENKVSDHDCYGTDVSPKVPKGIGPMADYRAFLVDRAGHVSEPPKIIVADTDEEAIEAASPLVDGHDVELWYLDRRVAVLKS